MTYPEVSSYVDDEKIPVTVVNKETEATEETAKAGAAEEAAKTEAEEEIKKEEDELKADVVAETTYLLDAEIIDQVEAVKSAYAQLAKANGTEASIEAEKR